MAIPVLSAGHFEERKQGMGNIGKRRDLVELPTRFDVLAEEYNRKK